jgi:hypothetical protein
MGFEELETRAINHIFGGPLIESIDYTPEGGDSVAIPSLPSLQENPFEDGRYLGQGLVVWVRASDVATPQEGDKFVWNTVEYTVRSIEPSCQGEIWKLLATANVRASA